MRPGDRLPGERALAEELGVGRSAVREAISALEVLGVVETRAGSGTYLRSGTSELLPSTLSWSLLMDQERTAELSVVRGALERSAAQLAALTATAEQKAELTGIVEDQRAAADDPEGYVAADVAFHRVLAQIGGNALVGELLATTRTLLRVWCRTVGRQPGGHRPGDPRARDDRRGRRRRRCRRGWNGDGAAHGYGRGAGSCGIPRQRLTWRPRGTTAR